MIGTTSSVVRKLRSDTPGVANVFRFIDVDDSDAPGQLDLAALECALGSRTKLIAIAHHLAVRSLSRVGTNLCNGLQLQFR